MARARSILLWALTVEVAVLAVSGVLLYFFYRPDAAAAWTDLSASLAREVTLGDVARHAHRWAAWLALPTSLATVVLWAVRERPAERVGPNVAVGGGLFVALVAASITGYLLPWDQLALFAVTVGTNISGYTWLRDGQVRFVLMGGTEIAPATLLRWLILHAVVLGGAVVGLLAVGWRRTRRPAGPPATDLAPKGAPAALSVDEPVPVDLPAGV